MGFESFNSSSDTWGCALRTHKIVSCSSSWTSCRCKIANGQTVEIRGLYWNDESKTSSKLVVYRNLTDMFVHFHRSFNKRHGLPHEWLGISLQSARSVISLAISLLYLPIFSSLFSRVFSWSKSLPDSRLNISSIQLKTCSFASYFLHYVLCYNNDTIFCFWRMLSTSKYVGALAMLVESPQNSTDKTLFPRTRRWK